MEWEILQQKKSGLSITSFILSVLGLFLCMTIIGVIIGVPFALLGLIFWIFALAYKQTKGLAIVGVVIGWLITVFAATILTIAATFVNNNKDVLLEPMKNFSQLMKDDPQVVMTMQDARFQADFKPLFLSNLSWKVDLEKDDTWEDMRVMLPVMYQEMVNTIMQLKNKYVATGFQTGSGTWIVQTGTNETGTIDLPKIEVQTGATGGNIQLPGREPNTCKTAEDCIPLPSECHPMSCINKAYEANYKKPEVCTMMFAVEAAYSAKDCACQKNVCVNKNL